MDSRFEANIIGFGAGSERAWLIGIDALFAGNDLVNRVAHLTGIPRDSLIVIASHTHSAPNLDPELPTLAPLSSRYLQRVAETISAKVLELSQCSGSAFAARHGSATTSGLVVNRRGWRLRLNRKPPFLRNYVAMVPNLIEPCLENIDTLVLFEGKTPKAVLWSFACHPVSYPDQSQAHPDYPGVIREDIRAALGNPELPVLFLPGMMGDQRPAEFDFSWGPMQISRGRLQGPTFGRFNEAEYRNWCEAIANAVRRSLSSSKDEICCSAVVLQRETFDCRELLSINVDKETGIGCLYLEPGVALPWMEAEPVAAYDGLVRRHVKRPVVLPFGYVGSVFGYLPTSEMIDTGGYEDTRFKKMFGVLGDFRRDLTKIVEQAWESATKASPQNSAREEVEQE